MEKELQHKLFNYQAEPPASIWDKINVVLDREADKPFPERLAKYEEDPPPFIWDNVAASLDEIEQKTIPLRQRFSKPLRYSAAAACLIAVAVLITLLINKNSVSADTSLTTVSPSTTVPASEGAKTENQSNAGGDTNDNSNSINHAKNQNNKISPIRVKNTTPSFKRSNYVVAHNLPTAVTDMPQRYIIYASSSGDAFRISKKLFDLFACSDVDEKCRENIELMQQQAASPNIMASADFSGLLDLLQSINNQ